jgi:hypothetical protein
MSALPAETSDLSPAPAARRPGAVGRQQRAERREQEAVARRARRRWAVFSLAVLGLTFAFTVGILDVLH